MIRVTLKPGREGPVRAGHPWVFSGALNTIEGEGPAGSLAQVIAADGSDLGIGYLNTRCSIAIRMLTRKNQAIGTDFISKRIVTALSLRRSLFPPQTTGYRLINGEGDFLPGVIVDVYDRYIVCQYLTAGADRLKSLVSEALISLLSPQGIYEKSEGAVRHEEGLANATGLLWGEEPPQLCTIQENSCQFFVNIRGGQKTGFFFDQRDNRVLVGSLAQGKRVLNGFAYTGGFGIFAAKQGAKYVISVDSSDAALQLARQNWHQNDLPDSHTEFVHADMFSYLREVQETFDLMVLDPPPFIRRRQDLKAGIQGYKELNRQAFRVLQPGAYLCTFSCSQHLSAVEFFQTVLFAATDARRGVQVLKHLTQAADHPVNLAHPEGAYLKGLWLRIGY
jgi:23S rRNA (cytosine1962-C5)-methyltransferase